MPGKTAKVILSERQQDSCAHAAMPPRHRRSSGNGPPTSSWPSRRGAIRTSP